MLYAVAESDFSAAAGMAKQRGGVGVVAGLLFVALFFGWCGVVFRVAGTCLVVLLFIVLWLTVMGKLIVWLERPPQPKVRRKKRGPDGRIEKPEPAVPWLTIVDDEEEER